MNQPFDDSVKSFYRRFFERLGMQAVSQYETFARSRAIDLVVECTEVDRLRLQPTIFAHFRLLNALELKGIHDPLTLADYNRIMMRGWGLGLRKVGDGEAETEEVQRLAPSDHESYLFPDKRTITIVCVTRPTRILNQLRDQLRFLPTNQAGVYFCDSQLPQWIIHPTELALVPGNYPLLPLARGEKLAQFIEVCAREGLTDYLQLVLDVGLTTDPYVIWNKILEVKQMKAIVPEETWPLVDRFLRETPEVLEKLTIFQEVLDRERRAEQQGEQRGRQQTLLLVLRHKFGGLPEDVVKRIEATNDSEQLERWIEQALDANMLTEIEFIPLVDGTSAASQS
jgi:hypothetical protein